jgi:hypothetical protein
MRPEATSDAGRLEACGALIEDILGAGKRLVVVAHVLASWCVRPYATSV